MLSLANFAKKHLHVTGNELEGPGGPALIIAVYSIKKNSQTTLRTMEYKALINK